MDLRPGEMLDRYRLVAPLGEGGQGSVWRAIDPLRPGAHVALKLLRVPGARDVDMERLRREARTLAQLSHPSLLRCHGLFEDLRRNVLGLVLDRVDGRSLAEQHDDARLTPPLRGWILRHLAGALRYLHGAGVVHRDVKPENVLLCSDFFERPREAETVKPVDLGIAAPTGNPQPLTNPGSVIGTAPFLPPELIDPSFWREPASGPPRDVFAFGVLAMVLLRGHHPTRLLPDAKLIEYLTSYRAFADAGNGWPPGILDDPWEPLYRGCLALRASQRTMDGAAIVALLESIPISAPSSDRAAPTTNEPLVAPRPGRTIPDAGPPALRPSAIVGDSSSGSRRRRLLQAGGAAALIAAAFVIAFLAASPQRAERRADSSAPSAASPPAPSPSPSLEPPPTPPSSASAASPPATPVRCPAETVAVRSNGKPFCMDQKLVTVGQYRERCRGCLLDSSAHWIGAVPTSEAVQKQTAECAITKAASASLPLNCVTWAQSDRYCKKQGKRLPSAAEWRAAVNAAMNPASPAEPRMGDIDDARGAPRYEWTGDVPEADRRVTCGGSKRGCDQRNQEQNRNSDLWFRCVRDPL